MLSDSLFIDTRTHLGNFMVCQRCQRPLLMMVLKWPLDRFGQDHAVIRVGALENGASAGIAFARCWNIWLSDCEGPILVWHYHYDIILNISFMIHGSYVDYAVQWSYYDIMMIICGLWSYSYGIIILWYHDHHDHHDHHPHPLNLAPELGSRDPFIAQRYLALHPRYPEADEEFPVKGGNPDGTSEFISVLNQPEMGI
jgi:hypothetical protein